MPYKNIHFATQPLFLSFYLPYIHTLIGLEPNVLVSAPSLSFPHTHFLLRDRPLSTPFPLRRTSTDNVQAILYRVHAPACSASCPTGAGVFQTETESRVSVSFPLGSYLADGFQFFSGL